MDTQVFSDFGIVGGSFILMLGVILYYVPQAFKAHFEIVEKLTNKFSDNLNNITEKNTQIADGFIAQLNKTSVEHGVQSSKLDAIHEDVKILIK